ncbi:MAG: hypothetical protein ACK5NE_01840 [Brachymonas sp.]
MHPLLNFPRGWERGIWQVDEFKTVQPAGAFQLDVAFIKRRSLWQWRIEDNV